MKPFAASLRMPGQARAAFLHPDCGGVEFIKKVCDLAPIPVNIMFLPDAPLTVELSKLGVARISYGPEPYRRMTAALKETGQKAFSDFLTS